MFKHTKKIISNFLICLLYAAFFIVQIFFNIGSSFVCDSNLSDNHLSSVAKGNYKGEGIATYNNGCKNKTTSKVRLNKRFHPESMPSLEFAVDEPINSFACTPKLGKPQDYLLISSILAYSLRGPPVVA
jgi:hypothetical protein